MCDVCDAYDACDVCDTCDACDVCDVKAWEVAVCGEERVREMSTDLCGCPPPPLHVHGACELRVCV